MKKTGILLFFIALSFTAFGQDYKLKQTLEGHAGGITSLVLSELTRNLIAGDDNGNYYIYNPESGVLVHQFKGHERGVRSINFNSTGRLMLGVSQDEIKIWEINDFKLLHKIVQQNYSDIRFALFSIADGFIYFSSGSRLYKTRSDLSQGVQKLFDFTDVISAGVITADRSSLIIANGPLIRVINTRSDEIRQELQVGNSPVDQLALLPGNRLVAWCKDGAVTVWNLGLGAIKTTPILGFKAGISSPMSFSSDGKLMVSGNTGYWARVWNWQEREVKQELFGHKGNVSASAFGGSDNLIYTGSADKTIKVWSKQFVGQPEVKELAEKKEVPPAPVQQTPPPPQNSDVSFDEKNIPVHINGRPVSQTETFEMNDPNLQVSVYDNLVIDGDTISLSFNGEWLLKNFGVERKRKTLNLTLKKGNNSLVLYAENLGKSPPNTAAVEFQYGSTKKIIRLRSDLKSCSAINFVYK